MAEHRRKNRGRTPFFSAVGIALLAIPGFALGLLGGVAWEDPGLLAVHLFTPTHEVEWTATVVEETASPAGDEVVARSGAGAAAGPRPQATPAAREPEALPPVAAPSPALRPSRKPREAAARAVSAERFAVQVGAFSESRSAEQLADALRKKGFDVYVSPGTSAGESRWRVRVGPLPSRAAAERTATRLKAEERLPTWVLDENAV